MTNGRKSGRFPRGVLGCRPAFTPYLALRRGRSLGRLTAVCPQRDLGPVRLPARQVARFSWVLGVLVGQLLLQEELLVEVKHQRNKSSRCKMFERRFHH